MPGTQFNDGVSVLIKHKWKIALAVMRRRLCSSHHVTAGRWKTISIFGVLSAGCCFAGLP